MSEIVKGVLGGAWSLVVGWFLPCALILGLFGVLVLPHLKSLSLFKDLAAASGATQALVLLVAAVVLGLVLAAVQTPLYRILEGYLGWPRCLQQSRIRAHQARRGKLQQKVTSGRGRQAVSVIEARDLERFLRYPDEDGQVAPTMLGNAIRRLEYYAQNRYQLDSQRLWYQLRAVAPKDLATEVDNARAGVDFFVCLFYLLAVLGVSALVTIPVQRDDSIALILTGVLSIALLVPSYWGAILGSDSWAGAVRAMVDVARVELAKAYHLSLPRRLEDERTMWQAVGWFSSFAYHPDTARLLDPWRARQ